jgi:hypothetical protein
MDNTAATAIVTLMKDVNVVLRTVLGHVLLVHLSVVMDVVIQMTAKLLIIVHKIVVQPSSVIQTIFVNINLEKLLIIVLLIVVYVAIMTVIILKVAILVLVIAGLVIMVEAVEELHLALMDKY